MPQQSSNRNRDNNNDNNIQHTQSVTNKNGESDDSMMDKLKSLFQSANDKAQGLFSSTGNAMDDALDTLFTQLDTNGDGHISRDEFHGISLTTWAAMRAFTSCVNCIPKLPSVSKLFGGGDFGEIESFDQLLPDGETLSSGFRSALKFVEDHNPIPMHRNVKDGSLELDSDFAWENWSWGEVVAAWWMGCMLVRGIY